MAEETNRLAGVMPYRQFFNWKPCRSCWVSWEKKRRRMLHRSNSVISGSSSKKNVTWFIAREKRQDVNPVETLLNGLIGMPQQLTTSCAPMSTPAIEAWTKMEPVGRTRHWAAVWTTNGTNAKPVSLPKTMINKLKPSVWKRLKHGWIPSSLL